MYKSGKKVLKKVQKIIFLVFLIAILITFPLLVNGTGLAYLIRMFGVMGLYVILALGLNVSLGLAGLFDLGFMAFYAIGAYSSAIFSIHGWNFWISTFFSIMITVTFRLLLGAPVLKLRGDYLAIVTLGFGEITRIVLNIPLPIVKTSF